MARDRDRPAQGFPPARARGPVENGGAVTRRLDILFAAEHLVPPVGGAEIGAGAAGGAVRYGPGCVPCGSTAASPPSGGRTAFRTATRPGRAALPRARRSRVTGRPSRRRSPRTRRRRGQEAAVRGPPTCSRVSSTRAGRQLEAAGAAGVPGVHVAQLRVALRDAFDAGTDCVPARDSPPVRPPARLEPDERAAMLESRAAHDTAVRAAAAVVTIGPAVADAFRGWTGREPVTLLPVGRRPPAPATPPARTGTRSWPRFAGARTKARSCSRLSRSRLHPGRCAVTERRGLGSPPGGARRALRTYGSGNDAAGEAAGRRGGAADALAMAGALRACGVRGARRGGARRGLERWEASPASCRARAWPACAGRRVEAQGGRADRPPGVARRTGTSGKERRSAAVLAGRPVERMEGLLLEVAQARPPGPTGSGTLPEPCRLLDQDRLDTGHEALRGEAQGGVPQAPESDDRARAATMEARSVAG